MYYPYRVRFTKKNLAPPPPPPISTGAEPTVLEVLIYAAGWGPKKQEEVEVEEEVGTKNRRLGYVRQ